MTETVLAGLRVVEFGEGVAAAFCGKLLAERGAEVIKVEQPEVGDSLRWKGPFAGGVADPEKSAPFVFFNTTKKSVTLDASTEEGRDALRRLIAGADVFVEQSATGRMAALGLGYDDLKDDFPDLIHVSITPYGQTGPYRDYKGNALTAIALSGVMFVTGFPDREPIATGVDLADYFAGMQAWLATLCALAYRDRYGAGQYVDVSEMESMATGDESAQIGYAFMGIIRRRYYSRHIWGYPQDPLPCKDGHVFVHPGPQGFPAPTIEGVSGLAILLGQPELDEDPLFLNRWERWFRWEDFNALLAPFFSTQTADELIPIAQALKMPFGPFLDVAGVVENGHLKERAFFRELEHPVAGTLKYTGEMFRMSRSPALLERAPLLGEHNALLLEPKAITTSSRAKRSKESAPRDALPLAGIRVLDLTQVWAGPTCTAILAALGADVIKIEGLTRQDTSHTILINDNDPGEDPSNRGPYYQYHNAGKKHVVIDLLQEEGIEAFKRLVRVSDVVVEAFSPRVMPNLGLTYDVLREIRPDLIVMSMSGYGQDGPYRDYGAYGMGLESSCGVTSVTGYSDGTFCRTSTSHNDPFSGFGGAGAVLLALRHREKTGEGQYIDLSEHEFGVTLLGPEIVDYQMNGTVPRPRGNRREGVVQGCYRCAGDDEWIVVSIGDNQEWAAFCRIAGHAEWTRDKRFSTVTTRSANHDLLDEIIDGWTAKQDQFEAFHTLQGAGVTAAPVLDGKQMLFDPHYRARRHCDIIDHGPRFGRRPIPRHLTPKFSRMDPRPTTPAPSFGQHNREVLRELAGYTDQEMDELEERQVIGTRPIFELPEGIDWREYLKERLTYPLEDMLAQGALKGLEPDYLEQLRAAGILGSD
jgi:crotonobetainyl-CoA:carnitine CoA-transferase CaiB-like acyl-CoA transferase